MSNSQTTRYKTQWSSQFFAAAELTRRGYLVSLTFGNAPTADLLVQSPSGSHFTVDVKGQSTRNFWLIQPRDPNPHHYFMLIYLSRDNGAPKYYIVSSDELMLKRQEYKKNSMVRRKYRDELGGINWSTAFEYENKWENLPQ